MLSEWRYLLLRQSEGQLRMHAWKAYRPAVPRRASGAKRSLQGRQLRFLPHTVCPTIRYAGRTQCMTYRLQTRPQSGSVHQRSTHTRSRSELQRVHPHNSTTGIQLGWEEQCIPGGPGGPEEEGEEPIVCPPAEHHHPLNGRSPCAYIVDAATRWS